MPAALLALTSCSSTVEIDSPDADPETRAACESFLADLPDPLLGEPGVEVSPDDALGRAWGDPPIVVTCGVGVPDGFTEFALCDEVNGIGWYVPDSAVADLDGGDGGGDVVLTVITHAPRIEVQLPAAHRPPADVMALVSDLVNEHGFAEVRDPCV
ncbi:DUF3515 family protein [Nocardioides sp. AE5]|uniref:DUF3515 family protein n=1 Tax=Nocardioides sp. AE5 TaxID=2962573 RepID=UPI002881FC96|nr:DUF3515 family protein [Nocardioides sp. AE5]MDT0202900.1 DUF3515 family protein [Nocardioides sp. AE5]